MILKILDFDDLDRSEIKFGLWMAFHHPRSELRWGLGYSLGIIKRKLFMIQKTTTSAREPQFNPKRQERQQQK